MWTARAPVTHEALQTAEPVEARISQSLQTWTAPAGPAKGPATMCTSYGLMTWPSLLLNLVLVPALILGALGGRAIARRISPVWFERIVLVLTLSSGIFLLVRA